MIPLLFSPTTKKRLLLDLIPNQAVAAYSLRKLRRKYAGAAIRVRRSSDNIERDIGFVNNVLDTIALLNFVGAGNGFIPTWYDQSGNGRNATQATANNQPRIVNAGILETVVGSNFPGIRYIQSSNTFLQLPTNVYSGMTSGECFWVLNSLTDPGVGTPAFHSMGADGQNNHFPWVDANVYDGWGSNARKSTGNPTLSLSTKRVYNVSSALGEWTSRIDGSVHFTTATNTPAFPSISTLMRIGTNGGGTMFFDGTIGEFIVFNSTLDASNRTTITNNLLAL